MDLVVDFNIMPYYSVFHSGFEIPPDTFSTIRDKISNENLMFGALVANSDNQGLTVPHTIYKVYNGNKLKSLIDKLREDKCPTTPIHEVVKNFPK